MSRRLPSLLLAGALLRAAGAWAAAAADPAPPPLTGTAQALGGRCAGAVQLQDGRLTVGGRELKLDDVLYLALQSPDAAAAATNALRLMDGDYWRADLLKLTSRAVNVQSPALGPRRALRSVIQALEFAPDRVRPDMDQPETMYLARGAPLPGSLVWIKDRDVAVNSPLGVLPLPRPSLVCYVLQRPAAPTNAPRDEVRLTDGSLLHGRLGIVSNQFTLQSALLDTLAIAPAQVRYVARAAPRLPWLSALPVSGAANGAAPELLWPRPGGAAAPCLQALRLAPPAALRYRLPAAPGAWVFQATVAPEPANVGDVRLEVRAGDRVLWQRALPPGQPPEAVAVPLPAGQDLELVVAFGDRLAYPAGVDLCDPFLRATEPGTP